MNYRTLIQQAAIVISIGLMFVVWHRNRFIQANDIDYKAIMGPPPAPGSVQATNDLYKVLGYQAIRSPADVERAQSEVDLSPFVFSRVVGPWFSADNLPQTSALLREAMDETTGVVDQAKMFYARPRPFVTNSDVKPCVKKESSFSYPGGHATNSMVLALVLAQIFPGQRDALLDEAKTIGADRVLGGVHYFTDVQAGQKLGEAIFNSMQKTPQFQQQLERAKIECAFHADDPQFR